MPLEGPTIENNFNNPNEVLLEAISTSKSLALDAAIFMLTTIEKAASL
jgi:hypothetical protein